MLVASDFRQQAREALKGNWGVAVLTGFVAVLLGGTSGMGSGSGNSSGGENSNGVLGDLWNSEFGILVAKILGIVAIWSLLVFIIGGAVQLGYIRFNLNLIDRTGGAQFSDLFSEFGRFGTAFCLRLLTTIFTVLWTLLFIIPGIIAVFRYAVAPYILQEHPEIGASEAIRRSKELMNGNKWRLFCLEFSFIGWAILSALTFGIGFLWLIPYKEAATAAFYREIVREQEEYTQSYQYNEI